ncbi:formyltetrahydrofolate deformylase [Amycolatopsis sacchari]|uniref:formyltetrahydrofolate deformylase n=1 Tax=Amycolatopsis sacchari TaxID=115433 RepID=UPI003EB9A57C
MQRHILTLRCPDRPGIVFALADVIAKCKGNIVDSAQFSDPCTGTFVCRMCLEAPETDNDALADVLRLHLRRFDPVLTLRRAEHRRRLLLMVSKFDHCLVDLLYRWDIGELPVEIPLIVSNHPDLAPIAKRHGVPFVHLPVSGATRHQAEAQLLELIQDHRIDAVVLARYMQVLSDELCRKLHGRVINIHHSFLPGFKGARPYHQAYERGVKLIGATAHYVTPDLDEGPIIEQDVVRVGHQHSAAELVAIGRDVERVVLARAVRLHAEDRIILTGARTVVFS